MIYKQIKNKYFRDNEEITEQEYLEAISKLPQPTYKPSYEELVVRYIRKKYSIDQELAILRQRDTKPSEFAEYNEYVESCKVRARELE